MSLSLRFFQGSFAVVVVVVVLLETYSSVSLFCFIPSISMKLGKTIAYPSLEGISLCGSVPMQSASSQWLWWESCILSESRLHLSLGYAGSHHFSGS